MALFLLWMWIVSDDGDAAIALVRQSFLNNAPNTEIGLVFDHYRYFDHHSWTFAPDEDAFGHVVFRGEVDNTAAVNAFEKINQYKLKFSFKAMQLKPIYGLTADIEKLAFIIHFDIVEARGFKVASGQLGLLAAGGDWQYQPLTEKALSAMIDGIFRNRDPYTILVMGLPYK